MRDLARRALPLCVLPALAACAVVPGDVPAQRYTTALIDSVPAGDVVLYRVEVRTDSTADTIPELRTAFPALAVEKTGIVGFAGDSATGAIDRGFRYDPEKRRVHDVELPVDLVRTAHPALSPDGRHVAYVGRVGDGLVRAVVRVWPRGRIVAAGPPVLPRRNDAHQASWSAPDSFQVFIETGRGPETFLVFKGTLAAGFAAVDTATVDTAKAEGGS